MPTAIKLIEGIRSYGADNVREDIERVFRAKDVPVVREFYDKELAQFRQFGVEGAVTTIQSGIVQPNRNHEAQHFYIAFYVTLLDGTILHHWQFKHPMPVEGKIALESYRLNMQVLVPKDDTLEAEQ